MFGIPNLYVIGAAAAAALTLLATVEQFGENRAWRVAEVDALKAQNETLHFDAAAAAAAAKDADASSGLLEEFDRRNQEKIDAAETIVARGYACISVDELRWFSSIGEAGPATQPPRPAVLPSPGGGASTAPCDTWPIIAARERAGRLSNARRIDLGVAAWKRMQGDYATGVVAKPPGK